MKNSPESRLGKWAVGMTLTYIVVIGFFFMFMAAGIVDFDTGHWWDITVGVAVPIALVAFVLSILAIRKEKKTSIMLSVILGVLVVLFLLTHSLFIND